MTEHDLALIAWARKAAEDGQARAIRERAGLTQLELAEVIGTTEASVSRWESAARLPRGELGLRYGQLLAELAAITGRRRVPA